MKLPKSEFTLREWLEGESFEGVPDRPDCYRRGHLKMGCDVDRGLSIQRARSRKQLATNAAFFGVCVWALLEGKAARIAALDYGHISGDFSHAIKSGWQKWRKENAASWIHSTDSENLAKAVALGASREF